MALLEKYNQRNHIIRLNFIKAYLLTMVCRLLADGKSYTKNFGTVSSGTYTINVTKNDDTGYGSRVKGSGNYRPIISILICTKKEYDSIRTILLNYYILMREFHV